MRVNLSTDTVVGATIIGFVLAVLALLFAIVSQDGSSTLTVLNRGKLAVADVTVIRNPNRGIGRRPFPPRRLGRVEAGDSVRFVIKGLGEDFYSSVLIRSDGRTDTVEFYGQVSDGMGCDDTLLVSDTSVVLRRWQPAKRGSAR